MGHHQDRSTGAIPSRDSELQMLWKYNRNRKRQTASVNDLNKESANWLEPDDSTPINTDVIR